MAEQSSSDDTEQSSWRWHHELAGFVGAISLIDAAHELTSTPNFELGAPLLLFGAAAIGHWLSGFRAADEHGEGR